MKIFILLGALCAAPVLADPLESRTRPDSHGPIGLMGEHIHAAGEWMFSYRFMSMRMGGSRDGDSDISRSDVLQDYMVTPTSMRMDMHMLGAMYAPSDRVTWMFMVPYVKNSMNHVTRMGVRFTTESEGLGDVTVSALLPVYRGDGRELHVTLGASLPTGTTNARDDTPAGSDMPLPYPMQLGSGTVDLRPAVTWTRRGTAWSGGVQAGAVLRLGRNSEGYSLGDRYTVTGWSARRVSPGVSASLRVQATRWEDIDGDDDRLNPAMVPTADPHLRSGTRVELAAGLNLVLPGRHRLAAELGTPVYEYLDGPQMETEATVTVGWQFAF